MTEIELLVDLHKEGERQGPGSPEATRKALELTGIGENDQLKIADIGCGSGAQTITLARNTKGHITAVDLFPEFLEKLDAKARKFGLEDSITTRAESMEDLHFGKGELDLIWSEGAIYIMGFEEGVSNWKRFLKPGGYLVVSELSWITHSRPQEIEEYWMSEYPQIDTISNKIKVLEKNGFVPTAHFILPPYCWMDHYYMPIQQRFGSFLKRHHYSEAARQLVESEKTEIGIYEKFKDYYSYGFYIAQKR